MNFSNSLKNSALGLALFFTANAQAAPLNLSLNPEPDTISSFMDVSYDASTEQFNATGFAAQLSYNSNIYSIDSGSFSLNAVIDELGAVTRSILEIDGTIAALGYNSGTLLEGSIIDFGYGTNETLEFTFNVTGGDAAGIYAGLGGIIIKDSGFSGSFASNWGTDYSEAASDTGVVSAVPEPSMYLLMGLGLITVMAAARRSRNQA